MLVKTAFHKFMNDQGLLNAAPSFAVAVSGGADSLCLALVAHEWVQENGGQLTSFTVDHGLRSESFQEALKVQTWMETHGISHHTLKWEGDKSSSGIQEKARKARYDLLLKACREEGCTSLLLGHHQEDQHETFFMRLTAGSGPDGLASMAPVSKREGIQLLRPFLKLSPEVLKEELRKQGQEWVEDRSNRDTSYTRVRFREMLQGEGLSLARLDGVIDKLQEDRDYIENAVHVWCSDHVTGQPPLYLHLSCIHTLQQLHPALGKRVLRYLIQQVNCCDYPLGFRQLNNLWKNLQTSSFSAITVGGCYLLKRKGGLHIQRELRAIKREVSVSDLPQLWDGRIELNTQKLPKTGVVRPIGPRLVPSLKSEITSPIPTVVWPTLPAIWKESELISVPHLEG